VGTPASYATYAESGRITIAVDGTDTNTAYGGQSTWGAGEDSAVYDDGTDHVIATDFQGAGGRHLHLIDQAYVATPVVNDGYVEIKVAGTVYRFMVAEAPPTPK
jgi:hypothetical protein